MPQVRFFETTVTPLYTALARGYFGIGYASLAGGEAPPWLGASDPKITYMFVHIRIYIYIYMYVYVCVCNLCNIRNICNVCVCMYMYIYVYMYIFVFVLLL